MTKSRIEASDVPLCTFRFIEGDIKPLRGPQSLTGRESFASFVRRRFCDSTGLNDLHIRIVHELFVFERTINSSSHHPRTVLRCIEKEVDGSGRLDKRSEKRLQCSILRGFFLQRKEIS